MAEKECAGYPGKENCGNTPTVMGVRCGGCQAGLLAWTLEQHKNRQRHTVGTPEWEADQAEKGRK